MIVRGWGAATHAGRVRQKNEDSLLAEAPVFVVADGVGGQAAGEVASHLAVRAIGVLAGEAHLTVEAAMGAVDRANSAIVAAGNVDSSRMGMATTLSGLAVVLVAGSEHWLVFNVGDSRVYRQANGELQQLTTDHSEAEMLVRARQITREGARHYGRRHIVTRALGTLPPPVVDSWIFPPGGEERFVICSDGLSTEVDDATITDCLTSNPQPQAASDALVARALAAGGRDNITVIVVDGSTVPSDGQAEGDTLRRDQLPGSGRG
jgi:serine/threonine protein phosphatase PrpC